MEVVMRYQHTQRGAAMLTGLLGAAALIASAAYFNPSPAGRAVLSACALGFIALAWIFSSLTVEVGGNELRWRFGPGAWTYRLPLGEVESIRVVRNSWLDGFGIRVRPGFRLYSVAGRDAVELRLRIGGIRRIGTDDATGLAAALASSSA
jgi:hypothetical protein